MFGNNKEEIKRIEQQQQEMLARLVRIESKLSAFLEANGFNLVQFRANKTNNRR